MYRTGLSARLTSTHHLAGGSPEESVDHAHDYLVEVTVAGAEVDAKGYLVDIDLLRSALIAALRRYEGRCLNELPEFRSMAPSLENLSREIYDQLRPMLAAGRSLEVRVWEDQEAWAGYEGPKG
ncbi:MAG: 6-carboxytetrahydropterin synthase [Methanomassiliicoccus sp.]|nr:6-carboxytetrahydropterin synthase [Methanomassiliicoccus sp.]